MLFNSLEFLFVFLPISLIGYFALNSQNRVRSSKLWLVFASLVFYGWWNIRYLPLILASICFNFGVGTSFSRLTGWTRKSIFLFGIGSNLALLGYFKYADFFISNINRLSDFQLEFLHIALPLGISFFTLTQIAYLVDSYNNVAKEYDWLNYSLFVSFFPHLLAGPIIHHKEMMPQFDSKTNKSVNYQNLSSGIFLFVIGLFKKVVLADTFGTYATPGFDVASSLSFIDAWMTSLAFTLQIYFDFSGYTDMALGSALMFNIALPVNFNSPYKALDIREFWRRWHITLTRFLRDYVYIPLGGNRVLEVRVLSNLLITFLIGGLWHGAGATFLVWGFLHGLAMGAHKLWRHLNIALPKIIAWFITFNFVVITWIFFRAKGWSDAIKVLRGMFGMNGFGVDEFGIQFIFASYTKTFGVLVGTLYTLLGNIHHVLLWLPVWLLIVILAKNSNDLARDFSPSTKISVITALLFVIGLLSILMTDKPTDFLYFKF